MPIDPDVRRLARMAPRKRCQGNEPGFAGHSYSNVPNNLSPTNLMA
jgi:hypothetical protein